MNVNIVKLRFHRPLHLSNGKSDSYENGSDCLHSDTISAAMFYTALKLYGEEIAKELKDRVVFSSAFPFSDKGGYWLPKPLNFYLDVPEYRKELKRIKYLKLDLFQRLQLGESLTAEEILDNPPPRLWERETTQRVMLDRISRRGMPFYVDKWYPYGESKSNAEKNQLVPYHSDRGLYFIYVVRKGQFPYLANLLSYLSDSGIGLHKNLGNGVFNFELVKDALELKTPQCVKHWMNLSLFRPSKADLNSNALRLDHSQYLMIKRGGWIASPAVIKFTSLRKKAVMMFTEGSTFSFPDEKVDVMMVKGVLENVRPDWNDDQLHDIWRDGRSIFLPL